MQQCELRVEVKPGKAVFITVNLAATNVLVLPTDGPLPPSMNAATLLMQVTAGAAEIFGSDLTLGEKVTLKSQNFAVRLQSQSCICMNKVVKTTVEYLVTAGVYMGWLQVAHEHRSSN